MSDTFLINGVPVKSKALQLGSHGVRIFQLKSSASSHLDNLLSYTISSKDKLLKQEDNTKTLIWEIEGVLSQLIEAKGRLLTSLREKENSLKSSQQSGTVDERDISILSSSIDQTQNQIHDFVLAIAKARELIEKLNKNCENLNDDITKINNLQNKIVSDSQKISGVDTYAHNIIILSESLIYLANETSTIDSLYSDKLSIGFFKFFNNFNSKEIQLYSQDLDDYIKISSDGITLEDIKQGGIGDCWLLSPVMNVALARPDIIYDRIKKIGEDIVELELIDKDGKPITITVDLSKAPKEIYPNTDMWVRALEQAYYEYPDKLLGRLDIEGGWENDSEAVYRTLGIKTEYNFEKIYPAGSTKNLSDKMDPSKYTYSLMGPEGSKCYDNLSELVKDNSDKMITLETTSIDTPSDSPPEWWVANHATVIQYENGKFYHSNPWGYNPPNLGQKIELTEYELNHYYKLHSVVDGSAG